MLGGLLRPTAGHIVLCGHEVSRYDENRAAEVRRRHLGFVFQGYRLFPGLTALDNVAETLVLRGWKRPAARVRASAVLSAVGLDRRMLYRPAQLSGGQQQRVAVARAVAPSPELIIGDEVTAALDATTALDVVALLKRHVTAERAVLLVTHDHRLERFADRVLRLIDGCLVESSGRLDPIIVENQESVS
jgi:putative ABC transport system ATP-binding protein